MSNIGSEKRVSVYRLEKKETSGYGTDFYTFRPEKRTIDPFDPFRNGTDQSVAYVKKCSEPFYFFSEPFLFFDRINGPFGNLLEVSSYTRAVKHGMFICYWRAWDK